MNTPIQKLPFNDRKHAPSRHEIELVIGSVALAELTRLESQIEWLEANVGWSMEWYENAEGWGYRASYMSRVLCILHFYKGFFTTSLSIPVKKEAEYLQLKELTDAHVKQFDNYIPSPHMKWITLRIQKREDTESLLGIVQLKLRDIKEKTAKKKKRAE